jgi:hypothetical protein
VVEVSPEAAKKRFGNRWYRVTEIGGRTVTVEHINFAGVMMDDDGWRGEILRDGSGRVLQITQREPHGRLVERQRWSEGGARVDLVQDDGATPRHREGTRITMVRRDFDSRGFVSRERFFGPTGRPRPNQEGAYGYAYENGRLGRWIRRTVLAADEKPGAHDAGDSMWERDDDDTPLGRDERYFDVERHPMLRNGVFHHHSLWDDAYVTSSVGTSSACTTSLCSS